MKMIEFTEDLLTGVPEMDQQHQVLVELLNETYELLHQGNYEAAREKLISGIVEYVNFHFASEEAFLRQIGFPEYEVHCKIHENFKKQILRWVEETEDGNARALQGILAMIWAWLFRHIAVKDKAYGTFCASCPRA